LAKPIETTNDCFGEFARLRVSTERRFGRWAASLVFAVLSVSGAPGFTSHACSLDGGLASDIFTPQHPQSLRVAYAINRAGAEKMIGIVEVRPSPLAFYKVAGYLNKFHEMLSAADRPSSLDAEFYVLLVEYGLWARFSPSSDGMDISIHVTKPDNSATVMVTGDMVIRAIVDRKITLKQAQLRDLVIYSGTSESILAAGLAAAIDP
jgi:hypothetical protein